MSAFLPRAIRSRRARSPTFIDKPNAVSDRARLHARRRSLPNLHMCVDEPRSSVARVRARAHESSAPSGHSAQSTSAAMASSIAAGLLEKQFTFYRCSVSIVAIPSAGEFVTTLFLSEKIFFWKKRNTVSIPRFNNNNSASFWECVCVRQYTLS